MYEEIFLDVTAALETLGYRHGDGRFQGNWQDKHWMNTPGPIYGGDTDNCGTGPPAAPNNVAVDEDGYEVIFRQPVNYDELRQVVYAAKVEVVHGYGADGDLHWSYPTIKEWWAEPRRKVEQEVRRLYEAELARNNKTSAYDSEWKWWLGYLKSGMCQYLRVYAFFLDNGRIPTESERLPEL